MENEKVLGKYLAPEVKVVEIKNQTMLCLSQDNQLESFEYGEDW